MAEVAGVCGWGGGLVRGNWAEGREGRRAGARGWAVRRCRRAVACSLLGREREGFEEPGWMKRDEAMAAVRGLGSITGKVRSAWRAVQRRYDQVGFDDASGDFCFDVGANVLRAIDAYGDGGMLYGDAVVRVGVAGSFGEVEGRRVGDRGSGDQGVSLPRCRMIRQRIGRHGVWSRPSSRKARIGGRRAGEDAGAPRGEERSEGRSAVLGGWKAESIKQKLRRARGIAARGQRAQA